MFTKRNFGLAFLLLLFLFTYLYHNQVYYEEDSKIQGEYKSEPELWNNVMKRILKLQSSCGDLCNTGKEVKPGEFIGTVKSDVNCKTLVQLVQKFGNEAPQMKPKNWSELPTELQSLYNYNGRVKVSHFFFDESNDNEAMTADMIEPQYFTKDYIDTNFINPYRNTGQFVSNPGYPGSADLVAEAADYINVTDKTILVIGTQIPWLEAILLTKRPRKIITLEYGYFISEYPGLTFIRPAEFRQKFLDGTLDKFDVVFTYSSLEHSGLGRYGDPLNPWGDIMSTAEAWCVSKPDAILALALPTSVSTGKDYLQYNAHRIYGPLMYSFMTTNWEFIWPTQEEKRNSPYSEEGNSIFQPVFVFKKQN